LKVKIPQWGKIGANRKLEYILTSLLDWHIFCAFSFAKKRMPEEMQSSRECWSADEMGSRQKKSRLSFLPSFLPMDTAPIAKMPPKGNLGQFLGPPHGQITASPVFLQFFQLENWQKGILKAFLPICFEEIF
jgi:hypothetical protein